MRAAERADFDVGQCHARLDQAFECATGIAKERVPEGFIGHKPTFSIARQQSLKIVYSTGATTRRGTDFDNFSVNWQLARF